MYFLQTSYTRSYKRVRRKNGIIFPEAMKEFFLISNGVTLFDDRYSDILGLDDIQLIIDTDVHKKGVYIIASINEDYVAINSKDVQSGKYLYAGDAILPDEFRALDIDFITFLDRLLSNNQHSFWNWFNYQKYYDFGN